jgi:hypothetical protein
MTTPAVLPSVLLCLAPQQPAAALAAERENHSACTGTPAAGDFRVA